MFDSILVLVWFAGLTVFALLVADAFAGFHRLSERQRGTRNE